MAPYKYYGEEENTCHKNCEEIGLKTNIVDNIRFLKIDVLRLALIKLALFIQMEKKHIV
jgi:hypothetical protein